MVSVASRTRSVRGRTRPVARRTVENELRRCGFSRIAGVDEVGRGCLAGPVVAAAVVLGPRDGLRGLRDSKLLTSTERARLYDEIIASCLAWAIGMRDPEEIDRLNIYHASLEAMRDAVGRLTPLPDFVLVDAFRIPRVFIPQRGLVIGAGGAGLRAAIAAASIVAKVTRDRQMTRLHAADPRYGFDRHKGYATADHLAAMAQHGYSGAHRRSFRPASLFDTID